METIYFDYEFDEETGRFRIYHVVTGNYLPRRFFSDEVLAREEVTHLNKLAN